ncbi:hypothetical protein ATK36_0749 [Amycolatopsis sulphurea]|uniref:Uncharacterized protein n=2 Tax=Amycolatopsis sulphurea TaxID=76022 RepID=A0A2A9G366_9PSEU|nr:hypothetical protein ATK36_0749 [Amycolatopsis sulphurea]
MTGNQPQFSGDPVQDRARRAVLVKLAASADNPVMAELARELLAGNVTPRRAVESQLYAGVLEAPAGDLAAWYGSLSESEKDAEAAKGESALRALADEHAEEPSPAPAQKPAASRHQVENDEYIEDFSERDWLDE